MFRSLLSHPLTRGLEVDAPETTVLRRDVIRGKDYLMRIYHEWYALLAQALPDGLNGAVLEIGSGGGFLKEHVSGLVTSDVLVLPGVSLVADGQLLPFRTGALRAIVMTNVFHHLPEPRAFLAEAARCLQRSGRVVMIEPWTTGWSRFVYGTFHPEPFRPNASEWEVRRGGPLSTANGALPWIIFERDRAKFEKEFPLLQIIEIRPLMPFRYLLSGGVSMRGEMPGWTFAFWRWFESLLTPWLGRLAMFARIVLERSEGVEPAWSIGQMPVQAWQPGESGDK